MYSLGWTRGSLPEEEMGKTNDEKAQAWMDSPLIPQLSEGRYAYDEYSRISCALRSRNRE